MEFRYMVDTDDRLAISHIYEESWKVAYQGIVPQEFLESIPKGYWIKALDSPEWQTLVGVENGRYIGTSSFCKSRFKRFPEDGEIISLYLLPEYMGQGYGKRLLKRTMDELQKQGFQMLFLWVLEENEIARRFYESQGFLPTDDYVTLSIGGKELRDMRYVYQYK